MAAAAVVVGVVAAAVATSTAPELSHMLQQLQNASMAPARGNGEPADVWVILQRC